MSIWVCAGCGCRYAAGAPRCPECPRTDHTVEEVDVPKISVAAGATYEEPPGAKVAELKAELAEAEAEEAKTPAPAPAPAAAPAAEPPAAVHPPKLPAKGK